ncbi:MAG: hypothetical protein ACTSWQ_07740 [Candidatus Thorarchaeota archaeon]
MKLERGSALVAVPMVLSVISLIAVAILTLVILRAEKPKSINSTLEYSKSVSQKTKSDKTDVSDKKVSSDADTFINSLFGILKEMATEIDLLKKQRTVKIDKPLYDEIRAKKFVVIHTDKDGKNIPAITMAQMPVGYKGENGQDLSGSPVIILKHQDRTLVIAILESGCVIEMSSNEKGGFARLCTENGNSILCLKGNLNTNTLVASSSEKSTTFTIQGKRGIIAKLSSSQPNTRLGALFLRSPNEGVSSGLYLPGGRVPVPTK